MLKLCRRYLNWIQNSVFEGELTHVKLKELLHEAKQLMDEEKDSCIIFKSREEKWLDKQVIGKEKNELDNILQSSMKKEKEKTYKHNFAQLT